MNRLEKSRVPRQRQVVDEVRQRIAGVNEQLLARGATACIQPPLEPPPCREAISQELMRVLAIERDRDVFELLYTLNVQAIHAYAKRRAALTRMDPWDVVEETFLRVYQRCQVFRGGTGATFTGWAVAIAENVIRDFGRRARRSQAGVLDHDPAAPTGADDPMRRAMAEECRETARASWGTVVALCAASIRRLPPRWREVLELREGEGLTYLQIAAHLHISKGHVSMLLYRSRRRILQLVERTLRRYED